MNHHKVGTREEWLAVRLDLLKAEKDYLRRRKIMHGRATSLRCGGRSCRGLGSIRIIGSTPMTGPRPLRTFSGGRSQLLVYHFMFGPEYKAGCPSRSAIADGFNGIVTHLAHHDVMLWAVSRAPLEKLQAYKRRMGWSFPWASSFGSDFNFDFSASFTEEQQGEGAYYNFRRDDPVMEVGRGALTNPVSNQNASAAGTDVSTYLREREGLSAFALEDGIIYHTYSAYARGVDAVWGMYPWLDRAPMGRNEAGPWLRRHDEYGHG